MKRLLQGPMNNYDRHDRGSAQWGRVAGDSAIAVQLAGVRQLTAFPTTARVLTGVQF